MVSILSKHDSETIRAAVAAAETATRGEIVTIVTRRSHSYATTTMVIALAIAFAMSITAHLFVPRIDVWTVLAIQAGTMTATLLLLDLSHIVPRFASAATRHAHVRSLARAQFAERGLHDTPDRAAILLLVSLDERCVELIADRGIDAQADTTAWQDITAKLTASIRRDGIGRALATAVTSCGEILTRHFPVDGPRDNRLGDAPVEI